MLYIYTYVKHIHVCMYIYIYIHNDHLHIINPPGFQHIFATSWAEEILLDLATRLMDALAFQDPLMAQHLPSQLAAAVVHGAVQLCTKSFQDFGGEKKQGETKSYHSLTILLMDDMDIYIYMYVWIKILAPLGSPHLIWIKILAPFGSPHLVDGPKKSSIIQLWVKMKDFGDHRLRCDEHVYVQYL